MVQNRAQWRIGAQDGQVESRVEQHHRALVRRAPDLDLGVRLTGHDMGVCGHQSVTDHEAGALLLVAARRPENFDGRGQSRAGQSLGRRRGRGGHRSSRRRSQGGEDLGKALLVQVVLQIGEHGRYPGQDSID